MKVYIAHNYAARYELKEIVVPLIESKGHTVTSCWITEPDSTTQMDAGSARMDLDDIDAADAILFYTGNLGPTPGRGKYFELGYAFANNKRCYLVGNILDCIFYYLPGMVVLKKAEDFPS